MALCINIALFLPLQIQDYTTENYPVKQAFIIGCFV